MRVNVLVVIPKEIQPNKLNYSLNTQLRRTTMTVTLTNEQYNDLQDKIKYQKELIEKQRMILNMYRSEYKKEHN